MLQPGKSLQQRPQYVIEEEIGVGGFGVTFKAKHKDLNFPVVIKTPNSRLCRDANYPKYVEGFRKEGWIKEGSWLYDEDIIFDIKASVYNLPHILICLNQFVVCRVC